MRQFTDRGAWTWALSNAVLECIAAPIAAVALITLASEKLSVAVGPNGIFLMVLGVAFGLACPAAVWLAARIWKLRP
ncbi:hypothetical protein [Curtobacterium sp. SL109]|jgi:hypothetical protein|uniref:hypothetical protein n=1 Tax=Curtobacterium sp. SL109 TaxID=2994662 RepID=UPI002273844A|nr:hypothetical protein [Curtobacterium sp. SL109]MCY1692807.1 hypothetical protein [Curtobacterium sp. SL109]